MSYVSIIIPNYNHTRFLGESIRSALNQTRPALEIIVVDDGSTDNCRELVETFGERVRYIYQENQGLAGARNTGIRAAQGELIGLLDADDQWLPGFLEQMVALANDLPNAAAYYCQAQCVDENGEDLPQILGGPPVENADALYWKLLRANFIIPSTTLISRERLMKAGLFDQSLRSCEDWDLWLRLLPKNEVIGTDACLVRYRVHGSSLSTDPSGMQAATRAVIQKHFGLDDGNTAAWSDEKRRAYGGVYRYHLLTSIQRKDDWQAGIDYLTKSLFCDPALSTDIDLFYDLAIGSQPTGLRGTARGLDLKGNEAHILKLLQGVFPTTAPPELLSIRKQAHGTAYYALGLLAYNVGEKSLSRKYLGRALYFRPELLRGSHAPGNLIKSLLPQAVLEGAKSYFGRTQA